MLWRLKKKQLTFAGKKPPFCMSQFIKALISQNPQAKKSSCMCCHNLEAQQRFLL